MPEERLSTLASALVLAGGLILIIAGIISLVTNSGTLQSYIDSPLLLSRRQEGVLGIVVAVIALAGYRQVQVAAWGVLLIILGIVTGGLGGTLILVSGLVSIVLVHVEKVAEPAQQSQPSSV